jgi:threonine dehydrogenase-like Zn-dependent dehydrogenase
MKSVAVFPARGEIALVDHPRPKLASPHDVALRMLEVGVCGTDREIASFEYGTPPEGSEYLVIGHESLGEVIEVGEAVTRVAPGDLVVPMVRRPCAIPSCVACREDRQDFCFTGKFTERGINGAHGFLTEVVVDHEKFMNRVPAELREAAILTEPLTIAEKALRQIWEVQQRLPWGCPVEPGKKPGHCRDAVVLGAGPVGLLGAMALAASGFAVAVYSREEPGSAKARLVESFGGVYVSAAKTTIDEIAHQIGNIDVIYEASGASQVSFELMRVLGTNGIFVFTGVPGRKAPIELDADLLMRQLVLRNQVVFGTVNADRAAFEAAIAHLGEFRSRWPDALAALVSGRHSVDRYRDLLTGAVGGIKNVITLNGA